MLLKFICAVLTRSLFILLSLVAVWRVEWVKNNKWYWCLAILFLPLVAEMFITLMRGGKNPKWFSPAIFLFLVSIIPSIWILELHHQDTKQNDDQCSRLNLSESIKEILTSLQNTTNESGASTILQDPGKLFKSVCLNNWILGLHQSVLVLLILGKWLMPMEGGLTRDELSQLLLIFVGTAADILEFTSETLSDVKDKNPLVVYIILGVWTWSMLQFPHHLSVLNPRVDEECEDRFSFSRRRADCWAAVEALFIHDGPFLVVRLTVMFHFNVIHQMLVFFAIKNLLVVSLNLYRLGVIFCGSRST